MTPTPIEALRSVLADLDAGLCIVSGSRSHKLLSAALAHPVAQEAQAQAGAAVDDPDLREVCLSLDRYLCAMHRGQAGDETEALMMAHIAAYKKLSARLQSVPVAHPLPAVPAVRAKPLEWEPQGDTGWSDKRCGFYVSFDPEDQPEAPYMAEWGEGDSESFATLTEAKRWCQDQIDAWLRDTVEYAAPPAETTEK